MCKEKERVVAGIAAKRREDLDAAPYLCDGIGTLVKGFGFRSWGDAEESMARTCGFISHYCVF
jgi:hypothetical protein